MPEIPATETNHAADAALDGAQAPRVLRRTFRVLLGLLASGALYLIAVRREAILIDLANFSAWCF